MGIPVYFKDAWNVFDFSVVVRAGGGRGSDVALLSAACQGGALCLYFTCKAK